MNFEENKQILSAIFSCLEGVYLIEEETKKVVYINAFIEKHITGLSAKDISGKFCYECFCQNTSPCSHCPDIKQEQNTDGIYAWEYHHRSTQTWYSIRNKLVFVHHTWYRIGIMNKIQDVMDLSHSTIGELVNVSAMVSRFHQQKYLLEWEAHHDRMTRLFNRGRFMKDCSELYCGNQDVTMLFIDIDNMKYVNDTYGHATGDQLIKTVSAILEMETSQETRCYRMGGDEFLVIDISGKADFADTFLEKYNQELEAAGRQRSFPCKTSVGVVTGNTTDGIEHLLQVADARMYKNKQKKGRY